MKQQKKSISINIGINAPRAGCGGANELLGAENDARTMIAIAQKRKFDSIVELVGPKARLANVETALQAAQKCLAEDGTLLLTYAGHGFRVMDDNGDERDNFDETWCLRDEPLIDDHLNLLLSHFTERQTIVVVADCCHSADSFAFTNEAGEVERITAERLGRTRAKQQERFVPDEWAKTRTVAPELRELAVPATVACSPPPDMKDFRLPKSRSTVPISAQVLYLASCAEGETSRDENPNGLFTRHLATLVNNGVGTYRDLIRKVRENVLKEKGDQHPGWACEGALDAAIFDMLPFSIR